MRSRLAPLVWLCMALTGVDAVAAPTGADGPRSTLVSVEVAHARGTYTVHSVTHYRAPPEAVYAVLSDYSLFTRISSAITEAGVCARPAADGTPRVYTTVRGCVLFFCRSVHRVEQLELEPARSIVARVEPEASDLHDGLSRWQFTALPDGGTEVAFDMSMTPAFWVPPVIGPALVKHRLARDGARAVSRIDALALEYLAARQRDAAIVDGARS